MIRGRHSRRVWQLTPVLLPREFHGQRTLAGYSPWDRKELNTTERLTVILKFYNSGSYLVVLSFDTLEYLAMSEDIFVISINGEYVICIQIIVVRDAIKHLQSIGSSPTPISTKMSVISTSGNPILERWGFRDKQTELFTWTGLFHYTSLSKSLICT